MQDLVPFLDLKAPYLELRRELDEAIARVLASGRYVLGQELVSFEQELGAYCGTAHAIGVASGLDALRLVLEGWGVGPGDEVIVPANAFMAAWLAVSHVGATVVPVEPDPESCNLDVSKVEAAITPRTKAIVAAHLYGQPADLAALMPLARARGLKVLEAASPALGAKHHGERVGSLGDAAAFGFEPEQNLGAFGDGGAVTTSDPELADQLRLLRNGGSSEPGLTRVVGLGSRLDELQAAVLRVKLKHLDEWTARRDAAALYYLERFQQVDLVLPRADNSSTHAWHLFVVRAKRRDLLLAGLRARGIEALVPDPVPPHRQVAYAGLGFAEGSLPIAEALHAEVLALPMGPHLTRAQQALVCDAVQAALGEEALLKP